MSAEGLANARRCRHSRYLTAPISTFLISLSIALRLAVRTTINKRPHPRLSMENAADIRTVYSDRSNSAAAVPNLTFPLYESSSRSTSCNHQRKTSGKQVRFDTSCGSAFELLHATSMGIGQKLWGERVCATAVGLRAPRNSGSLYCLLLSSELPPITLKE